jgi:hypothetical protein
MSDFAESELYAEDSQPGTGEPEGTPEPAPKFYDPNQVPEELQPTFKEMQAAFTRKTQALAAQRAEVAQSSTKAELLDQLLANDRVREFLTQLDTEMRGGPVVGGSKSPAPPSEVEALIQREIAKRLGPVADQNRIIAARLEKQEFERQYPEYPQYRDFMSEGFQGQLSNDAFKMEDAYFWARGKEAVQRERAARQQAAKSTQSVERGGVQRPTSAAPGQVNSFQDAISAALDELKMDRGPRRP